MTFKFNLFCFTLGTDQVVHGFAMYGQIYSLPTLVHHWDAAFIASFPLWIIICFHFYGLSSQYTILMSFTNLNCSLPLIIGAFSQRRSGDARSSITWQEDMGVRRGPIEALSSTLNLFWPNRLRLACLTRMQILIRVARVWHEAQVGFGTAQYFILREDLLVSTFWFERAVVSE